MTTDLRRVTEQRVTGIREEVEIDMRDAPDGCAILVISGELEWLILVTESFPVAEGDVHALDVELLGFAQERQVQQARTMTLRRR